MMFERYKKVSEEAGGRETWVDVETGELLVFEPVTAAHVAGFEAAGLTVGSDGELGLKR